LIWILVNNDYQLLDIKKKIKEVPSEKFSLIIVEHRVNIDIDTSEFIDIIRINKFGYSWTYLLNIIYFYFTVSLLDKKIKINRTDKLVIYTEYDLFNQYVIKKFKDIDCTVISIEDGMATAVLYSITRKDLPFIYKLKQWYINKFLLKGVFKFAYNGTKVYPCMDDRFIDNICTSYKIINKRNIENIILKNNSLRKEHLCERKAIFLNQPIYDKLNINNFIQELEETLINILKYVETVYFKFHPREKNIHRTKIIEMLNENKNIKLIESNEPIEELIGLYKTKYAISFHSASLLNLYSYGVEPVFIYSMFKFIHQDDILKQLDEYLANIGYNFINSFSDLANKYSSEIIVNQKCLSFEEII
jgi:hypothetical protein